MSMVFDARFNLTSRVSGWVVVHEGFSKTVTDCVTGFAVELIALEFEEAFHRNKIR